MNLGDEGLQAEQNMSKMKSKVRRVKFTKHASRWNPRPDKHCVTTETESMKTDATAAILTLRVIVVVEEDARKVACKVFQIPLEDNPILTV